MALARLVVEHAALRRHRIERREPLGPPRTRDIANAIVFFCSELSERVTGQALIVDGGYSIR